eukprot:CAMPEP_0169312760 /NCGR_PEP_ID=MMETSP1017-20121227/4219_1 /TAXON_ID=342587 /ORGANISM="Karlodinium micrum, Strain CCMP2283" /LENGTH=561 /DNA_ID=CAMNT_0009406579 /DNA_START=45 /DNA_END=1730 /DNA_ORIENTATION=+
MIPAILLLLLLRAVAKPPHVVFVLVDDMGFNDFYNSSDIGAAWPNVKQLARDACVHLEHFYTQPICTPTRGAFMTGRSPVRLGLQHGVIMGTQNFGLPLDEVTLAQKLQAVSYSTVGIGKWHLGMYNNASLPTRRGFNHWYGMMHGGATHSSHEFPPYGPYVGYLDLSNDEEIDRNRDGIYSAELFGAAAVQHIVRHKERKPQQPLFLYVAMQSLHDPLEAPARFTSAPACSNITNADRKTFCGMSLAIDEAIGNITSTLLNSFPGEEVVAFIAGDNGGYPNSAGNNCDENGVCLRGQKNTLWEGGVRNNALVCSTSLPSLRRGTVFSKGLIHIMDLHATIQELAGGTNISSKPLDGISIWSAITEYTESPRKEFLVNLDPCVTAGCNAVEAAYRFRGCFGSPSQCGDWKLLSGTLPNASWYHLPTTLENDPVQRGPMLPNSTRLLYNLTADPEERKNLATMFPQVVVALQSKIDAMASEALAPCNIQGGTCRAYDPLGFATAAQAGAWIPWISDEALPEPEPEYEALPEPEPEPESEPEPEPKPECGEDCLSRRGRVLLI